jgi:hypothetical protein
MSNVASLETYAVAHLNGCDAQQDSSGDLISDRVSNLAKGNRVDVPVHPPRSITKKQTGESGVPTLTVQTGTVQWRLRLTVENGRRNGKNSAVFSGWFPYGPNKHIGIADGHGLKCVWSELCEQSHRKTMDGSLPLKTQLRSESVGSREASLTSDIWTVRIDILI